MHQKKCQKTATYRHGFSDTHFNHKQRVRLSRWEAQKSITGTF